MAALAESESPQTLAYVLSSLSTLATRSRALHTQECAAVHAFAFKAAGVLATKLASLKPKDAASAVVALGTLEMPRLPEPVAARLQAGCAGFVGDVPPASLPRLAWAVARLQWRSPALLEALGAAALRNLPLLSPAGLAQLAWALAAADWRDPALVEAMVAQCARQLGGFGGEDKGRLAWALAHLSRHGEPGTASFVLRLVQSVTKGDVASMQAVDVAAVVWACGRLDQHPGCARVDQACIGVLCGAHSRRGVTNAASAGVGKDCAWWFLTRA
jgi:hypothetical protein